MTDEEVRRLADTVLRELLGSVGYESVEVHGGVDNDGDPALFLDAILAPKSPVVSGSIYGEALATLRSALAQSGETRFPYLQLKHPDDVRPNDNYAPAGVHDDSAA
jgi:hypothetical protein